MQEHDADEREFRCHGGAATDFKSILHRDERTSGPAGLTRKAGEQQSGGDCGVFPESRGNGLPPSSQSGLLCRQDVQEHQIPVESRGGIHGTKGVGVD